MSGAVRDVMAGSGEERKRGGERARGSAEGQASPEHGCGYVMCKKRLEAILSCEVESAAQEK